MQRNRILYFIIGVVLIIVGYIVRVTDLSIGGDIEEKKFETIYKKKRKYQDYLINQLL